MGWKVAEDPGGMLNEDTSHVDGGAEIGVGADDGVGKRNAIQEAERGEDHGEAEGDEAEATDGGDDIGAEEVGILELDVGKEAVELRLLVGSEREADGQVDVLESLVKLKETEAETDEIIVEIVGAGGEDIEPLDAEVHIVKDETTEEAVFGIGDECLDLERRAGEESREARFGKLDKLTVFAPGIRNHFVMEGFAKAIGKVSIIGLESVGEGVAFGFEDEANAFVVVQHLINRCGAAVGWD